MAILFEFDQPTIVFHILIASAIELWILAVFYVFPGIFRRG